MKLVALLLSATALASSFPTEMSFWPSRRKFSYRATQSVPVQSSIVPPQECQLLNTDGGQSFGSQQPGDQFWSSYQLRPEVRSYQSNLLGNQYQDQSNFRSYPPYRVSYPYPSYGSRDRSQGQSGYQSYSSNVLGDQLQQQYGYQSSPPSVLGNQLQQQYGYQSSPPSVLGNQLQQQYGYQSSPPSVLRNQLQQQYGYESNPTGLLGNQFQQQFDYQSNPPGLLENQLQQPFGYQSFSSNLQGKERQQQSSFQTIPSISDQFQTVDQKKKILTAFKSTKEYNAVKSAA